MIQILDVVAKAGVIVLVFLFAALVFGLVLNLVFSNLVKADLDDSNESEASGLLRTVPDRARKTRFPDCTETNNPPSKDEGEEN